MDREEKIVSVAAHIFALIPLWGIVGNALLWYYYKDKSETIVFHAKQAMFFQIGFLGFLIFTFFSKLFCLLLIYIQKDFGAFFLGVNGIIVKLSIVIYIFLCAFAAWTIVQGGNYEYPIIGKMLKPKEE